MMNREKGITSVFNVLLGIGIILVVIIALSAAYLSGKKGARDAQRAADVERIFAALKNYQTENNRFPDAVQNQPAGIDQYLERWPIPPQPPDGKCQTEQNVYYYQAFDNGNSYALTFCLGSKAGRYKSGLQTIKAP